MAGWCIYPSISLAITGLDNDLWPGQQQAIIWTNVGILYLDPKEQTYFIFIIEIYTFSFKKMHLKLSSAKWLPFCLSLNVLKAIQEITLTWHTKPTSTNINPWGTGVSFLKMQFYYLILITTTVTFECETGPKQWIFSLDCGYWWPGALASRHQ